MPHRTYRHASYYPRTRRANFSVGLFCRYLSAPRSQVSSLLSAFMSALAALCLPLAVPLFALLLLCWRLAGCGVLSSLSSCFVSRLSCRLCFAAPVFRPLSHEPPSGIAPFRDSAFFGCSFLCDCNLFERPEGSAPFTLFPPRLFVALLSSASMCVCLNPSMFCIPWLLSLSLKLFVACLAA